MITSLISLLAMVLLFFSMGIAVTPGKAIKQNFYLTPAFGLAALVGISYILSANFKITGANAVAITIVLLFSSIVLRIRAIAKGLVEVYQEQFVSKSLVIIFIPICTLLLPALVMGFKYFYGDVNFDFFFNSQDSWFLATHHVFQYAQSSSAQILPLNWSADSQGRFAISLVGAFFYKWFHVDPLQFNSLLLNSIVILFALTVSGFCKEFFFTSFYKIILAVLIAVMSAAYSQSYGYYLLGQASAIPVFILYCIFLSRLIDKIYLNQQQNLAKSPWVEVIILAVLLNILYFMYAIFCFFALLLTGLSLLICAKTLLTRRNLFLILKSLLVIITVFCIIHALIIPDTIITFKAWLATSTKVASGSKANLIVFPTYLKDSYFALLFGLLNYPSTVSIFKVLAFLPRLQDALFLLLGIGVLIAYCVVLIKYYQDTTISYAARAVIVALSLIVALSFYFVIKISPYGIFKLQAWFMPLLLPLFIYGVKNKLSLPLRSLCLIALILNLVTAALYLYDFTVAKTFVSVRGITGSKDISELADRLHSLKPASVALFLSNGIEEAWLVDSIRDIPVVEAAHNYQPLYEKDLPDNPCSNLATSTWNKQELLVLPSNHFIRNDITPAPVGGKIVYQNDNYTVLDPTSLQTLVYIGRGSYPAEILFHKDTAFSKKFLWLKNTIKIVRILSHSNAQLPWVEKGMSIAKVLLGDDPDFPQKFRWVEKGAEIIVYSNSNKVVNFSIEVTPGYVTAQSLIRNITITSGTSQHNFSFLTRSTLSVPNVQLHQGLTCLLVQSPDVVGTYSPRIGLIHKDVPTDGRLLNFAISNIEIKP